MFDIDFFKNCNALKKNIVAADTALTAKSLHNYFERIRSQEPFVFNIETTNVCNMECVMCPRPKLMKRPIRHMDMPLFEKIISQIKPHPRIKLNRFWDFARSEYSVREASRDENAFYFYTVSKSLTLHGFGEPLLDPHMTERIGLCSKNNIPTYFSCVPANINVEKVIGMMKAGLGTIKFSLDALDDESQRKIRGNNCNFTQAYKKICEVVKIKAKDPSIKTKVVVAMLELSQSKNSKDLFKRFMNLWRDLPVFAYIKSQDNRWFHEEDSSVECKSHYESQYCEFPWLSLTVMADGTVVPCSQDYNCEMVMGDANRQTLKEIWNSKSYGNFRKWHINGKFPKNYKCSSRCDIKLVCDRIEGRKNV